MKRREALMLDEREHREIEEEMGHYPTALAASVEALKVVQRHRGHVSDEALRAVAQKLDMTPAELESVATFYSLVFRRQVGAQVVLVCDSVSCWITGYDRVRERLCQHLGVDFGETTADGRFTLLPIPCLGACDRAPALMVGEDLHGPVDADHIDEVLGPYREGSG